MLTRNLSGILLRDIVPNCVYLWGTGKSSCGHFYFTNKVVARASHTYGINVGSNKDYLFSCCFESIEIRLRLPAHGAGCCCFLLSWLLIMDTGKEETPTVTLSSAGLHNTLTRQQHPQPALPAPQQLPTATPRVSEPPNHLWLTKRFKSRDTPSPKGLSKFIQLNYVSLLGTGNARRGSTTLPSTIPELVKSNTASSRGPVRD